jgi:hypothetical protein
MFVRLYVLGFAGPDQQEDGAGAQEQRVRAVIQVLPTEVPDVQPRRNFDSFQVG